MVASGVPSAEVVVLRPSRAQRVAGACTRALCAAPLLLGALWGGDRVPMAFVAALVAGAVVFGLDLAVRRGQSTELRVEGLVADGKVFPWWSIDDVAVHHHVGRDVVEVFAFGLDGMELEAPRRSIVAPNPAFDADVERIRATWERLRDTTARTPIDLRDTPALVDPADPADPADAESGADRSPWSP